MLRLESVVVASDPVQRWNLIEESVVLTASTDAKSVPHYLFSRF